MEWLTKSCRCCKTTLPPDEYGIVEDEVILCPNCAKFTWDGYSWDADWCKRLEWKWFEDRFRCLEGINPELLCGWQKKAVERMKYKYWGGFLAEDRPPNLMRWLRRRCGVCNFLLPPDDTGEVDDNRNLCPDCEKNADASSSENSIFFGKLAVPWKDRIWWNWYEKQFQSNCSQHVFLRLQNKKSGGFLPSETLRSGNKRKSGEEKKN